MVTRNDKTHKGYQAYREGHIIPIKNKKKVAPKEQPQTSYQKLDNRPQFLILNS